MQFCNASNLNDPSVIFYRVCTVYYYLNLFTVAVKFSKCIYMYLYFILLINQ